MSRIGLVGGLVGLGLVGFGFGLWGGRKLIYYCLELV